MGMKEIRIMQAILATSEMDTAVWLRIRDLYYGEVIEPLDPILLRDGCEIVVRRDGDLYEILLRTPEDFKSSDSA
jgi:hypothetical protein